MRRALAFAAMVFALVVSACGGTDRETAPARSTETLGPSTRLADLGHPGRTSSLFSLFNADQGVPRLVLLVSPT